MPNIFLTTLKMNSMSAGVPLFKKIVKGKWKMAGIQTTNSELFAKSRLIDVIVMYSPFANYRSCTTEIALNNKTKYLLGNNTKEIGNWDLTSICLSCWKSCGVPQGLLEFTWTGGCSGWSWNPDPALAILVLLYK